MASRPPGFDYPQNTDIWSPTAFDFPRIPKTGSAYFWSTIGRLRPGLTWAQARRAFEIEAYRDASDRRQSDAPNRPALVPLREQLAGPVRNASLILMGVVALLLMLACANIANLLLARTIARSTELRIRSALGASRARLTQQLLTETLLLSAVATLIGLMVAHWTVTVASAVQPAELSCQSYTILDWRVLGFAIAAAILTGLVFGGGPAVYAARRDATTRGRTATAGGRHTRMRNVLVGAQVAITIVLLTGSVALGRAFIALLRVDHGIRAPLDRDDERVAGRYTRTSHVNALRRTTRQCWTGSATFRTWCRRARPRRCPWTWTALRATASGSIPVSRRPPR